MPNTTANTRKRASGNDTLALFYRQPVVLEFENDRGKGFRPLSSLAFAAKANAVPLNLSEFMPAVRHFPIVFSNADHPMPLALLGLKEGQNLFLQPDGQWRNATYVPAYIRRYPFTVAELSSDRKTRLLTIDAACGAFTDLGSDPESQPIFEETGAPTPLIRVVMEFCAAYHQDHLLSQTFMAALIEQDLLVERKADMQFPDNSSYRLDGFRAVDPERLKALSPEILALWQDNGWLAAIHLHLASMQNWSLLLDANASHHLQAAL
jgi:hypothetical protein